LDIEEVAKLVKDQEEIEKKMLEMCRLNDTITTLMKEVQRLKEALKINEKGNNKENANKEKLEDMEKENK